VTFSPSVLLGTFLVIYKDGNFSFILEYKTNKDAANLTSVIPRYLTCRVNSYLEDYSHLQSRVVLILLGSYFLGIGQVVNKGVECYSAEVLFVE
jgi:hypothetical protein